MTYWQHTLIGLSLITVGVVAPLSLAELRRARQRKQVWHATQTARERAARRVC